MKYNDVIYGDYPESDYPRELASHIFDNYLFIPGERDWSLLDVGCGNGTHMDAFKRFIRIGPVCGVDRKDGVDFEKDCFPYPNNSFKFIFCKSVIEHIKNTDFFLYQCYRVLKPGGKIVFLTPSWEYNSKWFYDDYTHVHPFCRKGLQDALKINNFKNVKVDYFYHLPITWHFSEFKLLAKLIRLLPDSLRWKDKEETKHNVFIRFCKEVQLLAHATKGEENE